ncbi:hypothetical protein MIMGU_mgv1a014409mg [Erythranthe guttata]|uniref:Uncharacterized protein n=1 Tax=Erythranthe guttata TaxID=4155 RepID=A0A022RKA0_ERYGU|nr:hypothetical protein MIMGU_mgv1a014409mg [Erythranthe guttata]
MNPRFPHHLNLSILHFHKLLGDTPNSLRQFHSSITFFHLLLHLQLFVHIIIHVITILLPFPIRYIPQPSHNPTALAIKILLHGYSLSIPMHNVINTLRLIFLGCRRIPFLITVVRSTDIALIVIIVKTIIDRTRIRTAVTMIDIVTVVGKAADFLGVEVDLDDVGMDSGFGERGYDWGGGGDDGGEAIAV